MMNSVQTSELNMRCAGKSFCNLKSIYCNLTLKITLSFKKKIMFLFIKNY